MKALVPDKIPVYLTRIRTLIYLFGLLLPLYSGDLPEIIELQSYGITKEGLYPDYLREKSAEKLFTIKYCAKRAAQIGLEAEIIGLLYGSNLRIDSEDNALITKEGSISQGLLKGILINEMEFQEISPIFYEATAKVNLHKVLKKNKIKQKKVKTIKFSLDSPDKVDFLDEAAIINYYIDIKGKITQNIIEKIKEEIGNISPPVEINLPFLYIQWDKKVDSKNIPVEVYYHYTKEDIKTGKELNKSPTVLSAENKEKSIKKEIKEHYDNGKIKLIGYNKNGKWDGVYKTYFENGNKKEIFYYSEGNLEGLCTTFYEDGKNRAIERWKNNKKEGLCEYYYASGILKSQENYRGDKLNGSKRTFCENGKLEVEGEWVNNVMNGITTVYKKDGKTPMLRAEYMFGELIKQEIVK